MVLLGINETGKTNILRALGLLSRGVKATPDDLRLVRPDEPHPQRHEVAFTFALGDADFEATVATFREQTHGIANSLALRHGDDVLDVVSFGRRFASRLTYVVDVATNARGIQRPERGADELVLETEWLTPGPDCPASHVVTIRSARGLVLRNVPIFRATDRTDATPMEFLRRATAEHVEELFWRAIIATAEARLAECIGWSFAKDSAIPATVVLENFINNPASAPALRNMFELAAFPDPAATIRSWRTRTNGMRMLLDRISKIVSAELQKLWTDKAVSIVLLENGPHLECAVRDVHGIFDFEKRSDGFRRFAGFMLMVSARALAGGLEGALLLYDEPDASLHPAAARQLRDELLRLSERCKVVYSTHSIFMVDVGNVGRHYFVTRVNEETRIERARPGNVRDEEVLYNAIGHSVFADLREKNLVIEGWCDRRLIEEALKDHRADPHDREVVARLGLVNAGGVKNVAAVTPLLEGGGRSYAIVTDGDPPATEARGRYADPGKWTTYSELLQDAAVVTAEDFVNVEKLRAAIGAVTTEFPELESVATAPICDDAPVMRQLERGLGPQKLSRERRQAIFRALKSTIFVDLAPTDLRERATTLVARLAAAAESEVTSPFTRARAPSQNG